jgi:hypothetical protein
MLQTVPLTMSLTMSQTRSIPSLGWGRVHEHTVYGNGVHLWLGCGACGQCTEPRESYSYVSANSQLPDDVLGVFRL